MFIRIDTEFTETKLTDSKHLKKKISLFKKNCTFSRFVPICRQSSIIVYKDFVYVNVGKKTNLFCFLMFNPSLYGVPVLIDVMM